MGRIRKFNTEEERREHRKAYLREYALTHKDKVKEWQHRCYQKKKARYEEQGTTVYFANKESICKYRDAHRDEINRRRRERYYKKTHLTETEQLAGLFKDPSAAAAYRWLVQNKKQQEKQQL